MSATGWHEFVPRILVTVALVVAAAAAAAGDLSQQPVVFQAGNWKVYRGSNAMTDKTTCTGVYKDEFGIQLAADTLFISVSGGMQRIELRFDDNPPVRGRLPSDVEKEIGSITISGSRFADALQSTRLRTSVLTMVSGMHEDDLDLTGIAEAHQNIQAGCPGEPIGPKSTASAAPKAEPASGCSDRAKVKMKIKGLSEADIKDICEK